MPELSRKKPGAGQDESLERIHDALAHRPGFLIRRLHQIHVAIFLEECAEFNITPVQYSVLTALREAELDQKTLAGSIGIDRATTTEVLKRLESIGWLTRRKGSTDTRRRLAALTADGRELLEQMDSRAQRAHDRTVAPLKKGDRERFIRYMMQLVDASNEYGRATMKFP